MDYASNFTPKIVVWNFIYQAWAKPGFLCEYVWSVIPPAFSCRGKNFDEMDPWTRLVNLAQGSSKSKSLKNTDPQPDPADVSFQIDNNELSTKNP